MVGSKLDQSIPALANLLAHWNKKTANRPFLGGLENRRNPCASIGAADVGQLAETATRRLVEPVEITRAFKPQ
jgi:hypothetical protein